MGIRTVIANDIHKAGNDFFPKFVALLVAEHEALNPSVLPKGLSVVVYVGMQKKKKKKVS